MNSVYFCTETEMTVDEKYKKTLEEIEALKDHLGTAIQQNSLLLLCRFNYSYLYVIVNKPC